MPVGAFTASSDMMHLLSTNPKLGHITTFGDILSASACLATLKEITETHLMAEALEKENLFRALWYIDTRNKRKRIDARSDD
jgi:acetylornithine/succinyldiaminopimelate/putrescine aminotransferase